MLIFLAKYDELYTHVDISCFLDHITIDKTTHHISLSNSLRRY